MRRRTNLLLLSVSLLGACASLPSVAGVPATRTTKGAGSLPAASPQVQTLKRASPAASPIASPKASPDATPTPAPTPVPSYAVQVLGQVKLPTSSLLAHRLATLTPQGGLLIANNGGGLISNNSGGLLSEKGLGLIASDGLKLLSNNSGGLISNNSGGLISNNSGGLISNNSGGYRLLATEADAGALVPVEGMAVFAIDLKTGKILAGPVPTDAEGRYSLGFAERQTGNIGILAIVPDAEAAPAMGFGTLAPADATDKPVLTTDASQAIAGYLLSVMPYRLQPIIDAHKEGRSADDYIALHANDPQGTMLLKSFDKAVAMVPVDKLIAADQDGAIARGISARAVAYLDLKRSTYAHLDEFAERIRAYGATLKPAPDPALLDQVFEHMHHKGNRAAMAAMLVGYGKPEAEAYLLADEINDIGNEVVIELAQVIPAHQSEVLAPLLSLVGP